MGFLFLTQGSVISDLTWNSMIVQFGNTMATQSIAPVTLFPRQGIKCPSLWPMKVALFHNHGNQWKGFNTFLQ